MTKTIERGIMSSELLKKIKANYSDSDLSTFLCFTSAENIEMIIRELLEENAKLSLTVMDLEIERFFNGNP